MSEENNTLSIYDWTYLDFDLKELKKWVDEQIDKGNTKVKIELEWGHYDDISGLDLTAKR